MEGKWCLFPHYRPSQPSQLESWILFLFELCTQGLYFPHYLDRDRQHDVSNCLVTHLQPGVRLIAWSKVNWIDNMAISKWLNILAFHLLEVRKHSSFPTSFLIRSYQSQSFSVWPCESGLLPQALSSLGIDQGLIPITWQGQFHLILWGGRGEIFFFLERYQLICLSATVQDHCYFSAQWKARFISGLAEELVSNGDISSRCPARMAAIWKWATCYSQASAYPVYGPVHAVSAHL